MILFDSGIKIFEGESLRRSFSVEGSSRRVLNLLCTGGGKASLDIDIAGSGADVRLNVVYVCSGQDRLDLKVNMRHSSGGSVSNQLLKGIVAGKSAVSFDGKIVVCPDAQKTEAFQTNRSILLSNDAKVTTSPQLEIYADDVKCSHGAAVGELNLDEQFYMRSRGISLEEARRLQMLSFLTPALEGLPEDAVNELMQAVSAIE